MTTVQRLSLKPVATASGSDLSHTFEVFVFRTLPVRTTQPEVLVSSDYEKLMPGETIPTTALRSLRLASK